MKQSAMREQRIRCALGGSGDMKEGWTAEARYDASGRCQACPSVAASQTGRSVAVRQPDRAVRWRARWSLPVIKLPLMKPAP
jgi:hypothetical protein